MSFIPVKRRAVKMGSGLSFFSSSAKYSLNICFEKSGNSVLYFYPGKANSYHISQTPIISTMLDMTKKSKQDTIYAKSIKTWPEDDRPREKLLRRGPKALSNSELLAILLRTGTNGLSAIDLARKVMKRFGTFRNMAHTDSRDWKEFKGTGNPEPDTQLRDTENIPLKETIEAYFDKEVKPYVPDAWIDYSKTKVGYEIPMTRHFYVYEPPRKLEDIEAEIKSLEGEIVKLLGEVTK